MLSKQRRKFFNRLPILFLGLLIFSFSIFLLFYFLPKLVNNSFISPLAKYKIYKSNSVEDVLSKNNIAFHKVQVATDSSYIVFLKDDGQVRISAKNFPSQISSLQLILQRLTIEGKKFKRLDLRFNKPIIEF